ncbi:MAG: L1 protein [Varecia variegata papillomavirus 1]|nr:MAG: L1 protein [Varecia variegata papillomavirus 1]
MANSGKVYLPPQTPVARVLSTDDYVQGTSLFYHARTERLMTVGHPYFEIKDGDKVTVPKVSSCQYRAFRLLLPDPNRFALTDTSIYDPERERLVWQLKGLEIGRGGPLGIGTSGHPYFNKLNDTENPNKYFKASTDNRQNVSFDPKQSQLFVVGCVPCLGAHWDVAKPCATDAVVQGTCPPIQLVNSVIEDGNMGDVGLGAMNFLSMQKDHAGAPLDLVTTTSKYPDFLKMGHDVYGDALFFFGKREQMYTRHYFCRAGSMGDPIPNGAEPSDYFISPANDQEQGTISSSVYFGTPSGSMVTSDSQLFNRPYWLQRAQGTNNGICWGNQLFVTVLDTTRGTNFTLSVSTEETPPATYDNNKFKHYTRHVEEYDMSLVFRLCKVPLTADILAHINVMNPSILEQWQLGFVPAPNNNIEDSYRYLSSLATKCPDQVAPTEPEDPYKNLNFWTVDLTDKFSQDLDQFPLGRRFLFQTGLARTSTKRRKVTVTSGATTTTTKGTKRKRK